MKSILFIVVFFLAIQFTFGQEDRVVSGVLKDRSGEPIPGVNITIKGKNLGTVTDVKGFYKIKAPLGATLIYAFVGFKPVEMVVTRQNSKPVNETDQDEPKPEGTQRRSSYTPLFAPEKQLDTLSVEEGTAQFKQSTPSFQISYSDHYWWSGNIDVNRIDRIEVDSVRTAKIFLKQDKSYQIPYVAYTSSVTIDKPNKLPKLQNKFAQGRPVSGISQWLGPETGEIFSWGPGIDLLEFDGASYAFDKNGGLVAKGTGNGTTAKAYNPNMFFRNGSSFLNSIKVCKSTHRTNYSVIYTNQATLGLVPNAHKTNNSLNLKGGLTLDRFEIKYLLFYEGFNSNLMNDNPGLSMLIASVLTTPPTFDNANGYKRNQALKHSDVYEFDNLSQRSSAPGYTNNPYWLVNHMPDREKYSTFNNSLGLSINLVRDLKLSLRAGIEKQNCNNIFGYHEYVAGVNRPIYTDRSDKLTTFQSLLGLHYDFHRNIFTLNNRLNYEFSSSQRHLKRDDRFFYNDQYFDVNSSASRSVNSIGLSSDLNIDRKILCKIANNLSFSSTLHGRKLMYGPALSLGLNIHEFIGYSRVINHFKLRSNWGYSYAEAQLGFSFGDYCYQQFGSDKFMQSYFTNEVLPNFTLQPEKAGKAGIGLDLEMFYGKVNFTFDYYQNKSQNIILPVILNNRTELKNIADTKTTGYEINISFPQIRRGYWSTVLNFILSHYNNKVTDLYNGYSIVPLGGFTNVHTALIEGQPYGVIVGTAYQRNNNGELIIGNDGYPLVNNDLIVLGNPNPDYTMGLEMIIKYKNFFFSCLSEFRKGGEVWNGTENTLSYLGLSVKSTEGRNVLNYIYPGVLEDGTPNTIPVDFANPVKSVGANRWIKYGPSGVGEDAIQDATWFRIKELMLGTDFRLAKKTTTEISFFIRNPLLFTKYSGVDPATTLWGKPGNFGLDLFNMPNITSYGLSFKIML